MIQSYTSASFSGADTTIIAGYPILGEFKQIGNLQTISYSIHRDTDHVRSIGRSTAKGLVKGQVVVAGSAVFTVLNKHVLFEIFDLLKSKSEDAKENIFFRVDQLPPLEILIIQQNDYNDKNIIHISGVEFVNEGEVISIHDIITENTVNYFARSINYVDDFGKIEVPHTPKKIIEQGNKLIGSMHQRFL